MYPIKFCNLYFNKIWGGRGLEKFRNNLPSGYIGESWDVACHDNGMSCVENGFYKGYTFEELIKKIGEKLLGKKVDVNKFPLLVKLIDSREKLSIQVHPNDKYAKENENSLGKTEIWYILDAKENSSLIIGTKDCDKDIFCKAIEKGNVEKYLNKIKVKQGDCYLINSGLIHAICEDVTLVEIQQNSDITYRIYDYGRPRELHIDKSLDVIDFGLNSLNLGEIVLEEFDGFKKGVLCRTEYFTIEKYIIRSELIENSDEDKFFIFTCVDGEGKIFSDNNENVNVKKGDSIFIPATLGTYRIEGNLTLLKSYI